MIKNNRLIKILLFFIPLLSIYSNQTIFDGSKSIDILYSRCENNNAIQIVKQLNDFGRIIWQWDNKKDSKCSWAIQSTIPNFSKLLNSYLVIKIIGNYMGNSPELKLIDFNNQSTHPISLDTYMDQKAPVTGATVKIPIKKFFEFNKNESFNINNVKALNFDASYSSEFGKLSIISINIIDQINP